MAAKNSLNAIQFQYSPFDATDDSAEITATDAITGLKVGNMAWSERQLEHVSVDPAYRRQGLATEMWKRAGQAHKDQPFHYPEPIPSRFRTKDGDDWAWEIYNRGLSSRPAPNDYDWDSDEWAQDMYGRKLSDQLTGWLRAGEQTWSQDTYGRKSSDKPPHNTNDED